MRVISGSARGRRLMTPPDMRVRPTSDRVKEAIFNILGSRLGNFSDLLIMDIFAGTGSLGIEALSRGAKQAVFIDNHRQSIELIRKNLVATGFVDKATILQQDAVAALQTLASKGQTFHILFLDPPYQEGQTDSVLNFLGSSPLIDTDSIVVSEHQSKDRLRPAFGSLQQFDRRVYGDTAVSFLTMI